MQKAIFLDRDGVINYRLVGDYVKSYDEFCFVPDFIDFFISIKLKGYLAIIITNQQGIGKEIMTDDDLQNIHNQMQNEIRDITGYKFDDIYYCADLSTTYSHRRKPNPGMIHEAIEKWDIDKNLCWMIGDSLSDIIAGKNANLRTIYIGQAQKNAFINADHQFPMLKEAISVIE
jgi:D-glycero-D-manno-heptose 1,7-bisphosphate phosphatase